MATIKMKFRKSNVPDRPGVIYYQVTEKRVVRLINSSMHIFASEWDGRRESIRLDIGGVRECELRAIRSQCRWEMAKLSQIAVEMQQDGVSATADEIVAEFRRIITENTLFKFMEEVISQLFTIGKLRTAETYTQTFRSFSHFRNGEDILLELIDSDLMQRYQAWLKNNGNKPNTISFYMRILRAVYNRAIEKGLVEDRHPFRHVFTGMERTIKRALSTSALRRLRDLDLSEEPKLDFARDIFMLSFYFRGMSLIDLAHLTKRNICNNVLVYRRCKTGQQLYIRMEYPMQRLLDKWPNTENQLYLLPIITDLRRSRQQYIYALHSINLKLKILAKRIHTTDFSLYAARHSWATLAREKRVPIAVISEALGHENESTTRIYIASLSKSIIDRANSMVINSI